MEHFVPLLAVLHDRMRYSEPLPDLIEYKPEFLVVLASLKDICMEVS